LAIPAAFALKSNIHIFDRSLAEWRRNRQWFKETLRKLSKSSQSATPLPTQPLPTSMRRF
jgi:hypothetical protein